MADLGWGGVGIKEGRIAGHGKDEAKENPAFDMSFSGRKPEKHEAWQLLVRHTAHRPSIASATLFGCVRVLRIGDPSRDRNCVGESNYCGGVDSDGGGHSNGGHGGCNDGSTVVLTGVVTVVESPETIMGEGEGRRLRGGLCSLAGPVAILTHGVPSSQEGRAYLSDVHSKEGIDKSC